MFRLRRRCRETIAACEALEPRKLLSAGPLVNVEILASANQNGTYSSSLAVAQKQTVYFAVFAAMANVGTTNGSKTINSLTLGTDGVVDFPFNLTDTAPGNLPVIFVASVLNPNGGATSSTPGTLGADSLTGAKVVVDTVTHNPPFGVVAANTPGYQILLTGSFVVGNGASGAGVIAATFPADSHGGFEINGGSPVILSSTTAAQYVSYAPLNLSVSSVSTKLPPYITPSGNATYAWNPQTGNLNLTSGTLTFTADSTTDKVDSLVNLTAAGAGSHVVFQTWEHLAGLTLTGGATADIKSLGAARTHNNHNVLVIGTVNAITPPPFSIDTVHGSALDIEDNDVIIHDDKNLAAAQALAVNGRHANSSGAAFWNGAGIRSTKAFSVDNPTSGSAKKEIVAVAVDLNAILRKNGTGFSQWTVGTKSESLRADGNDIIIKYDYVGDFDLNGIVNATDHAILLKHNPTKSGAEWGLGDCDFNGTTDAKDNSAFLSRYLDGTGGAKGLQL